MGGSDPNKPGTNVRGRTLPLAKPLASVRSPRPPPRSHQRSLVPHDRFQEHFSPAQSEVAHEVPDHWESPNRQVAKK